MVNKIVSTAKGNLGYPKPNRNNRNHHHGPEIEVMPNQQKELRLQIPRVDDPYQSTDLRNKKNELLQDIKRKLKENIEAEIDRRVSQIENTQESSKMSYSCQDSEQTENKQSYSLGKDEKPLLNTQDNYIKNERTLFMSIIFTTRIIEP